MKLISDDGLFSDELPSTFPEGHFSSINVGHAVGCKCETCHVFEIQEGMHVLEHCVIQHRVKLFLLLTAVAYIKCPMFFLVDKRGTATLP